MHPAFKAHVDELEPAFQRLLHMTPARMDQMPRDVPQRGIYLLIEDGRNLYVGRSNTIPKRLRNHARSSATHFQATFAMRLAREATNRLKASYKPEGSRANLVLDEVFGPAFVAAKARVARMHVRYVEEKDPLRQALLEMYVALSLETPYNDFDNH
jgi:hypothetical protein